MDIFYFFQLQLMHDFNHANTCFKDTTFVSNAH
jgi:hypothetical protein